MLEDHFPILESLKLKQYTGYFINLKNNVLKLESN